MTYMRLSELTYMGLSRLRAESVDLHGVESVDVLLGSLVDVSPEVGLDLLQQRSADAVANRQLLLTRQTVLLATARDTGCLAPAAA